MKKLLASFLMVSFLAACANQTTMVNGQSSFVKYEDRQTFILSGIGQTQRVNAGQICGGASKVGKVETVQGPLDIILGMITFGIYTPRTIKIHCS